LRRIIGLLAQGSGSSEAVSFLKAFVGNEDELLRKKALIALALVCQGMDRIEVLPEPCSDTLNEYPLALALIEQGKANRAIGHKIVGMIDQMPGRRGRKNLILSLGIAFQGQGTELLRTYLEDVSNKGAVSERMAVTRALGLALARYHQLGEFQRAYGRGAGAAASEHIVFSSLSGNEKSSALPQVFYD